MLTHLEILAINPKIKVIDKGKFHIKWFDSIENTLKCWVLSAGELLHLIKTVYNNPNLQEVAKLKKRYIHNMN